jgi:hypothetical protein
VSTNISFAVAAFSSKSLAARIHLVTRTEVNLRVLASNLEFKRRLARVVCGQRATHPRDSTAPRAWLPSPGCSARRS